MKVKFAKIRPVRSPEQGTPESAGTDFFIPDDFIKHDLPPQERVLIPSGLKINIPKGKALLFLNRSGLASNTGIIVGACLVDSDYQGEVFFSFINTSENTYYLEAGDKIIQGIFVDAPKVIWDQAFDDETLFESKSIRGSGGFGSTDEQDDEEVPGSRRYRKHRPEPNSSIRDNY